MNNRFEPPADATYGPATISEKHMFLDAQISARDLKIADLKAHVEKLTDELDQSKSNASTWELRHNSTKQTLEEKERILSKAEEDLETANTKVEEAKEHEQEAKAHQQQAAQCKQYDPL